MNNVLMLGEGLVQSAPEGAKAWAYAAFILLVLIFLALDLGVFHREAHVVTFKEALGWSIVWVLCGTLFAGFVYAAYERNWFGLGIDTPMYASAAGEGGGGDGGVAGGTIVRGTVGGAEAAGQYLTGYVVEKSLAMDNIFVIAMIFGYFAVPAKYQHRVLFWGIIGAVVMRGGMIYVGSSLIMRHQWVLIVFGLFLLGTALKMALIKGNDDPAQNLAVRLVKRWLPAVDFYDGQRFFTRRTVAPTYTRDERTGELRQDPPPAGTLSGRWAMTPLFLALLLVEVTDLVFAVDSIPAIFAITPDPFIVFTSNIFAILGLRSLYFCLAALVMRFRYLKAALTLILGFVGVKLLLMSVPPHVGVVGSWVGATWKAGEPIKIDTLVSLVAVVGVLVVAVALSIAVPRGGGGGRRGTLTGQDGSNSVA